MSFRAAGTLSLSFRVDGAPFLPFRAEGTFSCHFERRAKPEVEKSAVEG